MAGPQPFEWTDDGVMRPLRPRIADDIYVVGQKYWLEVWEPRSANSHRHYFAALAEAWKNLPEDQAERFPTVESLRKWALVQSGYRDEQTHVCGSAAEAQRLRVLVRRLDELAVVIVRENVVTIYTAKSQSMRAMDRQEFQKSKDDVLGVVSNLIGVSPEALQSNAGRSA